MRKARGHVMDRRDFLKTGSAAAASALAPNAFAEGQAAATSSAIAGRVILPINRSWRFSRPTAVTTTDAAHAKDFDDSGFDLVVVPHTNIMLPWHSFDEKSYEFISLYRR